MGFLSRKSTVSKEVKSKEPQETEDQGPDPDEEAEPLEVVESKEAPSPPAKPEPPKGDEEPEVRKRTRAEMSRLYRNVAQGIVIAVLYAFSVQMAFEARALQKEIDEWTKGECELLGFADDCSKCSLTVQVFSFADLSITTVAWDAGAAMTYSYYQDNYILDGEMFTCCNKRLQSCCSFWDNEAKIMCDALGPTQKSELTGLPCPAAPWQCRFKLYELPEDTELLPGFDLRADEMWTNCYIALVCASLLTVCHPMFWAVVFDLLTRIAEMLVKNYFKQVTLTKVRKIRQEMLEEQKKKETPKGEDDDEDHDKQPWDTPIIEALDPSDQNAAALRWQCIDPILVGSVSAHTLREKDLPGGLASPRRMASPRGLMASPMSRSSRSLYGSPSAGPPSELPPALPGVTRSPGSSARSRRLPRPYSPNMTFMERSTTAPSEMNRSGSAWSRTRPLETTPGVDWRKSQRAGPRGFAQTPDRLRKGTARNLDGSEGLDSDHIFGRPGTVRETGIHASPAFSASAEKWMQDVQVPSRQTWSSRGAFGGSPKPNPRRKLRFDDDLRQEWVQRLAPARGKHTPVQAFADLDGYEMFVRPSPKRPVALPPGQTKRKKSRRNSSVSMSSSSAEPRRGSTGSVDLQSL